MTGVQYREGDASTADIVGTAIMFETSGVMGNLKDTNPLPVSGSFSVTGGATSAKQSDGSQKTQIVDGSGNVIGSTSNAIDVNIKSGASSGTQYSDGAARGTATGTLAMVDDGTNIQSMRGDTSGNATNVGNVAHDAADSGNPVKIGGRARSTEIAPVASDDRTDFVADLTGKQIVLPYANPENFVMGAITSAMTGTTSTSLIAAPGASLRNYITTIVVSNAHASVGTDVIIQDGSGGTTLMTIPAAAMYGGAVINLPVPLRQPTTNTAIFCANVTTGASTKVSAVGYKGA